MSTGYYGEIRLFAGYYAPANWAFCKGQTLAISSYVTLYSLLGTTHGGDGRTTFGLPDMRGRGPMHNGQGPGLSARFVGFKFGTETVSLTVDQIPAHTHTLQASTNHATTHSPVGSMLADISNSGGKMYREKQSTDTPIEMADGQVGVTGDGLPHENRMPSLAINFILCLQGVYPSRN